LGCKCLPALFVFYHAKVILTDFIENLQACDNCYTKKTKTIMQYQQYGLLKEKKNFRDTEKLLATSCKLQARLKLFDAT
jgi:hypothetical protein